MLPLSGMYTILETLPGEQEDALTTAGTVTSMSAVLSINIVRKSCRKHFFIVSNDWFPFVVGQSHYHLTQLSVKDVLLFQHCQQGIKVLCTR
jgi:hypothetical protein